MTKWYESANSDDSAIISSRIRLARNLNGYPFPAMLEKDSKTADKVISELSSAIISDKSQVASDFNLVEIGRDSISDLCLLEKHMISRELLKGTGRRGALINSGESLSLMLNEEDHLRLQAVFPGNSLDEGLYLANKLDDIIEAEVEYAFDINYGYLTACPTNTGTGMRASYMLHLPALEASGQLRELFRTIGKLGMTARGIYGEGSESLGSIYQISNQTTLGKSEQDIVNTLRSVAGKITEQEINLRDKLLEDKQSIALDKVYRAYGILKNARMLNLRECMEFLSYVRMGLVSGRLEIEKPNKTIYNLMMSIQYGGLCAAAGKTLSEEEADFARAEYIRKAF